MCELTPMSCRRARLTLALGFFLTAAAMAHAAEVDLNGNDMSDIWELLYNAAALAPNGDADGDGASNLQESIAGTDPFDPNSVARLKFTVVAGTNFSVSLPCALGKQYVLQSLAPETGWTNWSSETNIIARSGSVVTLAASANSSARLFRVAISDVDSDGDGISDWEEYQLNLDPFNPTSNGQIDGNGQPLSDYAFVTNRLAGQDVLTISATDPTANQPEPGQPAINVGLLTVTRGGFPLRPLTINLTPAPAGPGIAVEGVDHTTLPRSLYFPSGYSSQTIRITPLANTNRLAPVVATVDILPGSAYRLGAATNASVVIYPSDAPNGTGLTASYYTNSSSTYSSSVNFNAALLRLTRIDPVVDFNWSNSTTVPIPNTSGYYSVRWTGQIEPQYSETYYFDANTDDGVKVWVNDQPIIDRWVLQGATDSIGSIPLQAGLEYNIRIDYFNGGGNGVAHLYWYSASQSKQVVPVSRLFPSTGAPASVTSPLTAVGFLGQPFSFPVTGANTPTAYTAAGLPPGLGFNPANGLISGIPSVAGDYQAVLTASNGVGLGASVVDIQILDTGSSVTREVWLGVPGTNIADIPLDTPPTSSGPLGALEGITDFGDNYAERIRGFLTAPVTGNYYFWLAGSDSAELWVSNDQEPANKVRRAVVTAATPPRSWTLQPSQRSGWLSLVAGQRYYLEVLHKAGAGAGDNWSVGWLQDPTGTNFNASGVVPGYVLSRYFAPPPSLIPGTLYTAEMLAANGVTNMPVGSATLRLSADHSQAILNFSFSGISSPVISEHILNDPYLNSVGGQVLFDISAAHPQADGSYIWPITAAGTLSAADILEILNENKAYITILTANYPGGELNGHFTLADGSMSFTPPPSPPAYADDHSDPNAAARFLVQTTFGPTPADVASVQAFGYDGWINNQFALPASHHLPLVLAHASADPTTPYPGNTVFNTWWQQSITAPDQLRQRVAFALSEIMVVSDNGVLHDNGRALSAYYDTLLDNAFGNFRQLLGAVTLTPAMGLYLDMRGNDKGSLITGLHANENYAREIMQLFSIGLNRMWPDGTLVMNSQGSLVPTYDQNVIMGFASVFTGWNYYQANQANGRLPTNFNPPSDYIDPMVLVPTHHELGTKLLLDNVMLPQAWGSQADSTSTNYDAYGSQDLQLALDSIFNNQNVGPFFCRQLIQRLVTSNPSRDYLYRVVQKFNDNGNGVRGDLQAVLKAVLLDYEARSPVFLGEPTFGKQREPVLRVTAVARAFEGPGPTGGVYSESGTRTISINTTNAHRLASGDTVWLSFSDSSGSPPPPAQAYGVTITGPASFTINAPGISTGTYTQSANVIFTNIVGSVTNVFTNNAITLNVSGHGLALSNWVYLDFTSGGAAAGVYQVIWTTNNNWFAVATADSASLGGNALLPKWTGGGYTQSRTNVTFSTTLAHGLNPGDSVFVNFTAAGSPADGLYQVASVPDPTHFSIVVGSSSNTRQNGQVIYPLVAPPLSRSGSVGVQWSTWLVNATDSGSGSASLLQSPLNSPTVFNFFYPDYKFPGPLASAGLTTPEFQLTSDTGTALQMNFLTGGILNNTGNTNGLSSFSSGNGAVVIDLGPWLTPALTSNAGLPGLVDSLSSLLMGGQLSPGAKNQIVNYAATFPYSSTPSLTQMRDRARAVVHLLVTSPDFTIQK